jgi:hypothetical protein
VVTDEIGAVQAWWWLSASPNFRMTDQPFPSGSAAFWKSCVGGPAFSESDLHLLRIRSRETSGAATSRQRRPSLTLSANLPSGGLDCRGGFGHSSNPTPSRGSRTWLTAAETIADAILVVAAAFERVAHLFGAWLSLVERLVRDQEAGGSNPLAPTNLFKSLRRNPRLGSSLGDQGSGSHSPALCVFLAEGRTLLELKHHNLGIRSQPQWRSPRSCSAGSENLHFSDAA